jgi:hypothetical protein
LINDFTGGTKLITKAIVVSINRNRNKCFVRMPLFETASSTNPVIVEALISHPPGVYNNIFKNDVVFVSFEENALEKPIVIGKLYRGPNFEKETPGGMGVFNSMHVRDTTIVQAATTFFKFTAAEKRELAHRNAKNYPHMYTPKKLAYYLLDTENDLRRLLTELKEDFVCFKRWVGWKFLPENIHVDDGDLGDKDYILKYEKDKDKDDRKGSGRCEVCAGRFRCLNRLENTRPNNEFPEKPSTAWPPYPNYLSR